MSAAESEPMTADPICGVSSVGAGPSAEEAASGGVDADEGPASGEATREPSATPDERTIFQRAKDDAFRITQEKSREWTDVVLGRLRQIGQQGGDSIDRVPDRMRLAADQLELCIELIGDMRARRYRDISWPAALLVSGAILYAVSPADLVPDLVPALGSVDDAVVLSLAISLASGELRKYCEFKGYDPDKYFPAKSSD